MDISHRYCRGLGAWWEIFHAFLSPADFFFQNQLFLKNSFRNTIRVSNSLDPDQARHYVGPDLDPNCLQRLSAEGTIWQRVNALTAFSFTPKICHVPPKLKGFCLCCYTSGVQNSRKKALLYPQFQDAVGNLLKKHVWSLHNSIVIMTGNSENHIKKWNM